MINSGINVFRKSDNVFERQDLFCKRLIAYKDKDYNFSDATFIRLKYRSPFLYIEEGELFNFFFISLSLSHSFSLDFRKALRQRKKPLASEWCCCVYFMYIYIYSEAKERFFKRSAQSQNKLPRSLPIRATLHLLFFFFFYIIPLAFGVQ